MDYRHADNPVPFSSYPDEAHRAAPHVHVHIGLTGEHAHVHTHGDMEHGGTEHSHMHVHAGGRGLGGRAVTEQAPRARQARSARCPHRVRHWRIAFGTVGLRTPVCVYCGSPNPRPLTDQEWGELIDWGRIASVGDHVRTAIEAHEEGK